MSPASNFDKNSTRGTEAVCHFEKKAQLRAEARAQRVQIADDNSDASASLEAASAIACHLVGIPTVWDILEVSMNGQTSLSPSSAPVFASYAPSKGEINPNAFLDLLCRMEVDRPRMAFPRVVGRNTLSMHFALLEELAPGSYGIPEPKDSAQLVLPEDIAVILVPGLAFDRRGNRLGYGKGYYDHYLPTLSEKALAIGISYDECLYDEIPAEKHDVCMDYIVTPTEVLSF